MDWLYMYMPIAGVNIFWPGLVLIGFSVGTIGGFFGMCGAWMVTPGLNILGFPMGFAIGKDMAHIAGKKKKAGAVEGERGTEGLTWYKTFHKINIPPMVHFKTAGFTCSAWLPAGVSFLTRSEERRVGKECRSRW